MLAILVAGLGWYLAGTALAEKTGRKRMRAWLLAAVLGLAIPLTLQSMKRDPALGASVLVTALTDSMGFFIFLGLAAIFLTP